MTNPLKWSITSKVLALSLFLLVLVAIYYVQSQYFEGTSKQTPVEQVTCVDLVRSCDIDGVNIKFDHEPQVMQPFHLQLQTVGAENVVASLAMANMQMGANRYRLLQQTPEQWAAQMILPICMRSRSDWLLEIEITKAGGIKRYQLSFTSNGHSPQPE